MIQILVGEFKHEYLFFSPDTLKNCSLVGFNLGNTCQRIGNVCVLHRECSVFNENCGKVEKSKIKDRK